MPPSQRWFTYGIPARVASSWIVSWACFLVPTKSTVPPFAATSRTKLIASSSFRTVCCRSMMWMPLRSVKMKVRMRGSQRRVWWPKWTPASSSSFIETGAAIGKILLASFWPSATFVPGREPTRGQARPPGPVACVVRGAPGPDYSRSAQSVRAAGLVLPDVVQVFVEGAGEDVAAVAAGDEVQRVAGRRVDDRLERGLARIADRPRWQARLAVGVVRRGHVEVLRAELRRPQRRTRRRHAGLGDRVLDRWVGLP